MIWSNEALEALYRRSFPREKHAWRAKSFQEFRTAVNVHFVESPDAVLIYQIIADEAEILLIMTQPDARQSGAALEVMRQMFGHLASLAVETVFLEVARKNQAALALYEKFGFEEVGLRKAYYQLTNGETDDALILQKRII